MIDFPSTRGNVLDFEVFPLETSDDRDRLRIERLASEVVKAEQEQGAFIRKAMQINAGLTNGIGHDGDSAKLQASLDFASVMGESSHTLRLKLNAALLETKHGAGLRFAAGRGVFLVASQGNPCMFLGRVIPTDNVSPELPRRSLMDAEDAVDRDEENAQHLHDYHMALGVI